MGISDRKRRGRGIAFGAFLTLLAVQATMSYGINGRRLYWADTEYGTTVRHLSERKAEFPDRPIVLVLGSSRAQAGVAADRLSAPTPGDEYPPLVLDSCLGGAHPIHSLYMLRRLIAIGVKPTAVLIEILPIHMRANATAGGSDPAKIDMPLNPATEAKRLRAADYELIRTYDRDREWTWIRTWFEAQAAPWYTHRYTLTSRYAETWAPKENISSLNNWKLAISPYGWNQIKYQFVPEEIGKPAEAVAERVYRQHLQFTEINASYDRMLRDLLKLCRDEGIEVMGLLIMPEGSRFRAWYADDTRRLIREYAGGVAAENGTRVIDCNTWSADEYFVDGHHLIDPGAALFSERLRAEVAHQICRHPIVRVPQSLLHGYEIANAIQRISDDVLQVEEGSLYPALQRMLLKGWVKGAWGVTAGNRRARYYKPTAAGRKQLLAELEQYGRVSGAIQKILGTA